MVPSLSGPRRVPEVAPAPNPIRAGTATPPWEVAITPAPLRLLVVTEVRFLGEALAAVLEREASVMTVTCATAAETIALRFTAQADAVLVDAAHCDGTATVRRLREFAPQLPIIACAVRETDEDVVLWAEAGVTGYLPNTIKLAQIGRLVSGILDGEQICSARAAAALLRRVAAAARLGTDSDATYPLRELTRRERQIAELIAAGRSDKQIARELNIGLSTTKTHVHNLLGKLNLRHRGDVAEALLGGSDFVPRGSDTSPRPELAVPDLSG
jgi:two-component system nitrate/nitrite response regulator NarL